MDPQVVAIATRYLEQRVGLYWDKLRQYYTDLHRASGGCDGDVTLNQLVAYANFLKKQAQKHERRLAKKAAAKAKKIGPPSWTALHYQYLIFFHETVEGTAMLWMVKNNRAIPATTDQPIDILDPELEYRSQFEEIYVNLQQRVNAARRSRVAAVESNAGPSSTVVASPGSGTEEAPSDSGREGGGSAQEAASVPRTAAETQQCPQTS